MSDQPNTDDLGAIWTGAGALVDGPPRTSAPSQPVLVWATGLLPSFEAWAIPADGEGLVGLAGDMVVSVSAKDDRSIQIHWSSLRDPNREVAVLLSATEISDGGVAEWTTIWTFSQGRRPDARRPWQRLVGTVTKFENSDVTLDRQETFARALADRFGCRLAHDS